LTTETRTAVVTGASSGIGAATARRLRTAGFDVIVGARRIDRLEQLAQDIGAKAVPLDVSDTDSVAAFCEQIESCNVLVNNAGGAFGLDPVEAGDEDEWTKMYDVNVIGIMRMCRGLIPKLEQSGDGHIVNIGSVASRFVYPGGGGYTAVKHAERAVTQTLRGELLGRPIRVTDIQPGMVETEFSLVRFGGDKEKADAVYEGVDALTADDIADCIAWAITRPSHVNIDEMMVTPRQQVLGFGQQIVRDTTSD
jgi:NADP-dependent 3-hydroxy acid dehydrogenase YdfG